MATLTVTSPTYSFNNPNADISGDVDFVSEPNFYRVDSEANDLEFRGNGFTYAQTDLSIIGLPSSFAVPTGGKAQSFAFYEDGIQRFTLDGLSISLEDAYDALIDGGSLNAALVTSALFGNDTIVLANGNDAIDAGPGNDTVTGGGGSDTPAGGDGIDMAVFAAAQGAYGIFRDGGTVYVVDGSGAADRLSGFEALTFSGGAAIAPAAVANTTALEYVASYGDLRAAFGANAEAGLDHRLTFGVVEGREATFSGLEYIASYGDLIAAFGADENAGAAHYIQFGAAEGRQPGLFDAEQYLDNYADLQAVLGTNAEAAAAHFIAFGATEGRTDDPLIA